MSVQSAYENSFTTDLFLSSDVWAGLERSVCLGPPSLLTSEDTTGASLDRLLLRTSAPPQRIGPYRLLAEIGHGGMGAVFRVIRDDAPDQEHALKIIRPGVNRHLLRRRFLREMQIQGTLRHPYMARVLDWGVTSDGEPFLVMDLVNGIPLNQYCESHMLSVPERLLLFRKVCAAVEATHEQGVIHRDLKPANILIREDATPVLLDFGIAKLRNAEGCAVMTDTTLSQPALLTPQYASPEQICGEAVTPATDIYSLGVLLYELLTGLRPPRALRRVTPGQLVRTLRSDLERIVLKALHNDPARRHCSAGELASDVEHYLHRRSRSAQRLSRLRRFFVPDVVSRSLHYFAYSHPAWNELFS